MRVAGIDPSLTATGLATAAGIASTVHGEGDGRLGAIYAAVITVADHADLVVVEDLPVHGMGAGKTGMAQGAVRLALQHIGVPYVLVTAATVKKFATGRGNATKPDMRMEWFRRTGFDIRDDNQGDALWLRQLGLHALGVPEFPLPKVHTDALAKVTIPESVRV